ncbi:hypothetical protein MPLDJ20_150083 [Mesorhizobium plurifarium]|uniref:Uncharacterized protein n=1 Tax=Mesorhizobium plurifarium TaxID=69974 RepID=A0A090EMH8_MESPL|nr:hypothetical protein MPLDJ20_150083 [Mesorhizobium plurifarium]
MPSEQSTVASGDSEIARNIAGGNFLVRGSSQRCGQTRKYAEKTTCMALLVGPEGVGPLRKINGLADG